MIESLISALGLELGLTSKEIADVVWLALQMNEVDRPPNLVPDRPEKVRPTPQPKPIAEPSFQNSEQQQGSESKPSEPQAGLYAPDDQDSASMAGALALKVPDARSMREPLSLARALKPLLRKVMTGYRMVLDETATVERIAEEGVWLPVLQPSLEPWLELALVVDESVSMQIWRRTIVELQRFMEHYGVFRDVRVWGLLTDEQGQVQIRPGMGKAAMRQGLRRPSELIDPSGRRLILVVTDCVSPLWRDGTTQPALKLWAASGPMAIVQMLPEWLWARTGLGLASTVRFQTRLAGLANQQLRVRDLSPWDDMDVETGVKVPVVTLEPERFGAWAEMMTGKGGAWATGVIFEAEAIGASLPLRSDEALDGEQRVQQFRVTASPMARQLAGLLASAPVISLPIVRIIQERLLKDSRQVHVAEVFLGGLLKPLVEITPETNVDSVQYEFLDGVRDVLLESMRTSETIDVLNEVSQFVAEWLGLSIDAFMAVLREPQQLENQELVEIARPFAIVTAQILKQLGSEYLAFARMIEKSYLAHHAERYPRQINPINISKFFQATNPSKTLQAGDVQDDKYYVDFSSVRGGRLIEELRGTIVDLSPDLPTCSLFTGHIGCGKSTELLRLQKLLEADGFHVVYFDSSDDLEMADVDIGDVILSIAKQISQSLEKAKVKVKIEGSKLQSLLAKTNEILLTPIDLKVKKEVTISALIGELTVKAKYDRKLREKLNQFVVPRKNMLVAAINDGLIVPAIEKLKKQGKKGLVVIVDNLDRLDSRVRIDGKSQHEYLFIDQSECLTKLACHLVYTLPLSMKFGNEYGMLTQRYDNPLVLPIVPLIDRDGNSHDAGMVLLRQMVLRRAMPEGTDEERLLRMGEIFESGEALDRLCRISGGHSRDLLRLLNSWIKKGQQLPLRAETLERVIRERRNEMVVAISDDEWELLRQVWGRKKVSGDEAYQILISSRWVFEYRQLDESWFDVNPILLEAAEMNFLRNYNPTNLSDETEVNEKNNVISYVEIHLDDVPEYMMGVFRCGSVISYNEVGDEITDYQDLIDNKTYHSYEEIIQDISRKLNISTNMIEIID